jgi:hypothetical protein
MRLAEKLDWKGLNIEVMLHWVKMQQMSQYHPFIFMYMGNYSEYELDRNLNKY